MIIISDTTIVAKLLKGVKLFKNTYTQIANKML